MRSQGRTPTAVQTEKEHHREVDDANEDRVVVTLAEMLRRLDEIVLRQDEIQTSLALLVSQRAVKDWYDTAEAAELLGKAEFTVREWCREGRVHAEKKGSGRGKHQAWVISHQELQRIQREGLLPVRRR
jgi:hypothetical protein